MTSLLMCPPTHYDVRYAINPWMSLSARDAVDPVRAQAQWAALVVQARRRCEVSLVEADPAAPDMCFTANAGLVRGRRFVRSNFLHRERRAEEAPFERWFRARGFECHVLPREIAFEGAGDALFGASGDRLWMGHGRRTVAAAAPHLQALLDVEVTPLRLVDARFYHLDTCFCPLSNGALVYYPGAFDAASRAAIEAGFDAAARIEVRRQDALAFSCNLIDVGAEVLVSSAGTALRAALRARGVRVTVLDLGEFIKAGGGAKCLALPFDGAAAGAA